VRPLLSVILPLYDEAETLQALIDRVHRSASNLGVTFEIIAVNDASRDETAEALNALQAEARIRALHLPSNRGQLGATLAGVAEARGEWICVMDGDLQDPPEQIGALLEAAEGARGSLDVVFATKRARADAAWMRAASAIYGALGRTLLRDFPPRGAGSYCVFSSALAARLLQLRLPIRSANLSVLLCALGARAGAVPYEKAAREHGDSRVGLRGLVREALGSFLILSPLGRRWLREPRGVRR